MKKYFNIWGLQYDRDVTGFIEYLKPDFYISRPSAKFNNVPNTTQYRGSIRDNELIPRAELRDAIQEYAMERDLLVKREAIDDPASYIPPFGFGRIMQIELGGSRWIIFKFFPERREH